MMDINNKRELLNQKQFRQAELFRSGAINEADRTVDVSFSSELPVLRMFGAEILDHSSVECADLARLRAGGAVLVDHEGDQVGCVMDAAIDITAKRGNARLKFSKSIRGQEIFQDIVDGIRKNISFAYMIDPDQIKEEGNNNYRAMKWTPLEISVVGVPADASIGIGRSLSDSNKVIANNNEGKKLDEDPKIEAKEQKKETKMSNKIASEILAIAEKHPELIADAREAIKNETSLEDFQRVAMTKLYNAKSAEITNAKPIADIGMSEKEVKQYSIVSGIRALMERNPGKAALEFEASRAVAKKLGKDPQGFFVPNEILNQRTLTVGTPTAGGNLVATDLLSASFIELLRNKMVCISAGAQTLSGLVGDIAIPKQTGGATAYWVSEGVAPTTSQQTLGQVALAPKTLGAFTDYTRKLLLQSSIGIEQFVRNDLSTVLAIELDRVGLNGSGAGAEPTGILPSVTGGYVVALGTNGAAPTHAGIVGLETVVDTANALIGNMSYITNAKARGKLKTTVKVANYPVFLMGDDGMVNGYKCHVTNQIPSNLTKNSSGAVCSAMIFGNFNDLIFGLWGALDVNVDPFSLSTTGSVRVVVLQEADVAIRHLESFSAIKDMLTT